MSATKQCRPVVTLTALRQRAWTCFRATIADTALNTMSDT